jgi:hypothetical protein
VGLLSGTNPTAETPGLGIYRQNYCDKNLIVLRLLRQKKTRPVPNASPLKHKLTSGMDAMVAAGGDWRGNSTQSLDEGKEPIPMVHGGLAALLATRAGPVGLTRGRDSPLG